MIPITKNKRKSLHDSANYRSIALSSIIGKVFDRVILTVHSNVLNTSERQFGFKAKHSTVQCSFIVQETANYYAVRKTPCYVLLLDASKAFDRVEYGRLFSLLVKRGMCPRVARVLLLMYTKQSMKVRWSGVVSNSFNCTNGIKQGGVLSPTLFCVYFDELQQRLEDSRKGCCIGQKYVGALGYADDVALLAPTPEAARAMLKVCEDYASDYNVLFNGSKSVLVMMGERRPAPSKAFELNGNAIEAQSRALHLGNWVGEDSMKTSIKRAGDDLVTALNMLMTKFGHCTIDTLLELFGSYCTSFYGSPLWHLHDIDSLLLAWRKCVKRLYKISIRTRSKYVRLLTSSDLQGMLAWRQCSFFSTSLNSENEVLSTVCKNVSGGFVRSLCMCAGMAGLPFEQLMQPVYRKLIKTKLLKHARDQATVEEVAGADAIVELCRVRDTVLVMGPDIGYAGLLDIFV